MNRRIYRGTMCYSDMRKLLFVCHGNICRSPMAATLMRVMANAAGWGDSLWVDSCGVSDEEEGNPMDRRAGHTHCRHGHDVPATFRQGQEHRQYANHRYIRLF